MALLSFVLFKKGKRGKLWSEKWQLQKIQNQQQIVNDQSNKGSHESYVELGHLLSAALVQ